jgi:hypothetical protein
MAEQSGAVREAGWGQWAIHLAAEWAAESHGQPKDADLNEQEEMTCIERYMKTRKQVATRKKSAILNENIAWHSRGLSPPPTNQRSNSVSSASSVSSRQAVDGTKWSAIRRKHWTLALPNSRPIHVISLSLGRRICSKKGRN